MSTSLDKSQEHQYFKKLLGSPEKKTNKVQNYLKMTETAYEEKIKLGSFHIKQTSDKIELRKNQNLSRASVENMRYAKKNLQKSLKLVDSKIEELTEPDKKSSLINDEERLKFVSQMTKARRELDKKRQKKIEEQLKKEKQLENKQLDEQKKKQQQSRQKRKQEIIKRAESLEVVRKNKKLEAQQQKKQLKQKLQQKILSERMIEKFKKKQENVLQQRKKKLAQIREIHKPLTKSDFQIHLQKIQKLKNQKSRIVDKQDVSKYITNDANKFYKSKWYEKTKKEHKTYEDQKHQQELQQLKEMKDKLKKYSEYVRQNFKPQIDQKKAKQLNQKNKSMVQGPKTEDLRELGLKYLQYSKQHIDPSKKNSENEEESNSNSKKLIKPKNYLQEIKKNSKGAKNPQQYVQNLKKKKNLPEAEKAQKILQFIEGLERKVKMREQKAKINNVIVDQQLDNMYMEAIQMKLKMLGNQDD